MQRAQRVGDGPGQRLRVGRGHHAARGAQEQLVAQQLAQPAQRVADAGLRDAQALRHGRHPAVLLQLVEDDQQVQVQVFQVHAHVSTNIHSGDLFNFPDSIY